MKNTKIVALLLVIALGVYLAWTFWPAGRPAAAGLLDWPEITPTAKPWTRWWWHGSAVDTANLSRELEACRDAGLGGVELTPIFGLIGQEDDFADYLSPEWLALFAHSLQEAQRLGLGIDMATGTGWPFGGPWVSADDAPKYVAHKTYRLRGGEQLREPVAYTQEPILRAVRNQLYQLYGSILRTEGEVVIGSADRPAEINPGDRVQITDLVEPVSANDNLQALALDQVRFEKPLPLQALVAYSEAGEVVTLTDRVDENDRLDWTAPAGDWTLYAVFQGWHGKMVERAAPGGEGNTLDHFSEAAIRHYLARFDTAFAQQNPSGLRAFFNDSYEVDDAFGNADWTPRLFEEFQARRGYDLRRHLPALFGQGHEEQIARVGTDYRETLSELILETFTQYWRSWAHERRALIRNQAHGSPANILDLYGASDIPETEGEDLLMIKFASSAANVEDKPLVSSESATWLNEHFLSSLADLRKNLERYFLGGVNHVFYHGTTYSPREEAWPGRLFYAAVHLNPRNTLWRDFAALNRYAARVQSFLQDGRAANDVLLYFPIYDRYAETNPGQLEHFHGREPGFEASAMKAAAELMLRRGFTFDYVSDKQLREFGRPLSARHYRTVVVPSTRFMPLRTLQQLSSLAEQGNTVIFLGALPASVPGLGDLEQRLGEFEALKRRFAFLAGATAGVQEARVGQGRFLLGDDLERLLRAAGIKRENMADLGLQFTRRSRPGGGYHYFVANWKEEPVVGWITLGVAAASAALFDPEREEKGLARTRTNALGELEVYLQLAPHQSCILKTFPNEVSGAGYPYRHPAGEPLALAGPWAVTFLEGGPQLPPPVTTDTLGSWTHFPGQAYGNFSGTAVYRTAFSQPQGQDAGGWLLDLGRVAVSARVKLNGEELGTLIGPRYSLFIPAGKFTADNTLEIEVTNLMANRIADLDRRGVLWKRFYNVNFPARLAQNQGPDGLFTAAGWAPLPSGLLGPVRLQPVVSAGGGE